MTNIEIKLIKIDKCRDLIFKFPFISNSTLTHIEDLFLKFFFGKGFENDKYKLYDQVSYQIIVL